MGRSADNSTLRVIDANLNRAVEGVRVVEDALRFVVENAPLADRLRNVRHRLREGAKLLPGGRPALLSARDSVGDIARNAPAKSKRTDISSLAAANLSRAQEAVRTLEEFSKLIAPKATAHFGEIRFLLYDLDKDISAALIPFGAASHMPAAPFLYAVADYKMLSGANGSFSTLKQLCAAGAGMIQLREKNSDDAAIMKMALKIRDRIETGGPLFVVNDRVDLALAARADVVHIGQEDLPVADVRRIAGDRLRIGFSTHSMRQAQLALEAGPDYISVGPVFSSPTKPDKKSVGIKLLKKVCATAGDTPVVAIGGVSPENLDQVLDAGASGAAMISALANPKMLPAALDEIREGLKG